MMTPNIHLNILFEGPDLLVVNKPAGILSIPDGYDPDLPHLRQLLEPDFGRLWMVHRLDKDTSGAIVLARNSETHRQLNQAFRTHEVQKIYHGLVSPTPDWVEQVVDLPLKVNADRRHRTRVDLSQGKPAWTHFQVLDKWPLAVRMEMSIKTGLTHQIRSHLRELGFALAGENLYNAGLPEAPFPAPRAMLHARELSFLHPTSGERVSFSAPYPDDFRSTYQLIRHSKDPAEAI